MSQEEIRPPVVATGDLKEVAVYQNLNNQESQEYRQIIREEFSPLYRTATLAVVAGCSSIFFQFNPAWAKEMMPGVEQALGMYTALADRKIKEEGTTDTLVIEVTREGKILSNGKDVTAMFIPGE